MAISGDQTSQVSCNHFKCCFSIVKNSIVFIFSMKYEIIKLTIVSIDTYFIYFETSLNKCMQ